MDFESWITVWYSNRRWNKARIWKPIRQNHCTTQDSKVVFDLSWDLTMLEGGVSSISHVHWVFKRIAEFASPIHIYLNLTIGKRNIIVERNRVIVGLPLIVIRLPIVSPGFPVSRICSCCRLRSSYYHLSLESRLRPTPPNTWIGDHSEESDSKYDGGDNPCDATHNLRNNYNNSMFCWL